MQALKALIAFRNVDGAFGDGQGFFRVEGVISGGNLKGAAADGGIGVGMDGIISRINGEAAAGNQQIGTCLHAFHAGAVVGGVGGGVAASAAGASAAHSARAAHSAGSAPIIRGGLIAVDAAAASQDLKGTPIDLQVGTGADAVALRRDIERTILDIDEAQRGIVVIFPMDAILTGSNSEGAAGDTYIILACKAVGSAVNGIGASRGGQLILGDDAVTGGRSDRQGAGTIEGQVLLGIDHGINAIFIDGGKGAAVGKGILSSLCQGQEHLVRLEDVNRGGSLAVDGSTVQNQLNLIGLVGIDNDHAVIQSAGKNIDAFPGNGDGSAVDFHFTGCGGNRTAIKRNGDTVVFVIGAGQVPVGKQVPGIDIAGNGSGCGSRGFIGARCPVCSRGFFAAGSQQQGKSQKQRKDLLFHGDASIKVP